MGDSCSCVEIAPSCGRMSSATFDSVKAGVLHILIMKYYIEVITPLQYPEVISKIPNLQTRLEVGVIYI